MPKKLVWLVGALFAAGSAYAQTSTGPARSEVVASFGVLVIDGVEVSDKFPPGCGAPAPGCSAAQPGHKVLMVWVKAKGDADAASRALMMIPTGVYVQADDGARTDVFSGGMMAGRLFVAFTPPQSGKNFSLHWDKNVPIALGK